MLLAAGVTGVTAVAAGTAMCSGPGYDNLVLFQGDSITDARRSRQHTGANEGRDLGNGYVSLIAAGLLLDHPERGFSILNRGVSGNRVRELRARWERDCLELRPTILSVLIGINDLWLKLRGESEGTVSEYRAELTELLERTRDRLPECRIVLCEPFASRLGHVDDRFFPELDERRAVAAEVARGLQTDWVGFQAAFDDALGLAPAEHWSLDGIHPTLAGHALMARVWREQVGL